MKYYKTIFGLSPVQFVNGSEVNFTQIKREGSYVIAVYKTDNVDEIAKLSEIIKLRRGGVFEIKEADYEDLLKKKVKVRDPNVPVLSVVTNRPPSEKNVAEEVKKIAASVVENNEPVISKPRTRKIK